MARIACPHCSQQLEAPGDAAGKSIRCPKCQQVFPLPEVSTGAASEAITTVEPIATPTARPEEGITESPAVTRRSESGSRPRRDRDDAPASSSMLLPILLIGGLGVLGVCMCGGFAVVGGLFSFNMAAQDMDHRAAEMHAHDEMRPDLAMVDRDMAPADKKDFGLIQPKGGPGIKVKLPAEKEKSEYGEFKRLKVPDNRGDVRTVSFTADGNALYVATRAESVHSWDLATWTAKTYSLEKVEKGFGDRQVGAAAFTPSCDRVYLGKHGGSFCWYDLTQNPAPQTSIQVGEPNRGFAFNHIAISNDGKRACTSHGDSVAYVWDVVTRTKLITLKDFNNQVFSGAFDPKSEIVAAGAEDVQVFDPKTDKKIELKGNTGTSFTSLLFSRDARFLAGVNGKTFFQWDTNNAKVPLNKLNYDEKASYLAYSPDGLTLAVALHDTRLYFYEPATMKQRMMIDMRQGRDNWDTAQAIAFHPDSRRLAFARGGTIYLFDMANLMKWN